MKKLLIALAVSALATTAFADGVTDASVTTAAPGAAPTEITAPDPAGLLYSTGTASATLTVNGTVTQSTCKIGSETEGGAADQTVELPQITTNHLRHADDTAGETSFSVSLVDCPAVYPGATEVYIKFDGSDTDKVTDNGKLKNTVADGTSAVVEIVNDNREVVNLKTSENSSAETLAPNGEVAILQFSARYSANGTPATAGRFASSIPFTVAYK